MAVAAAIVVVGTVPGPGVSAGGTGGVNAQTVIDCRPAQPLCWPTAFAFTPDGNMIFYAEMRTGQIRRFNLNTGVDKRWVVLSNLRTEQSQGLLGIALDPRWGLGQRFQWVYVYQTLRKPARNRIVRLLDTGNRVIKDPLRKLAPAAPDHNGGVLTFGPDGKLWVVTGDAFQPGWAQSVRNPAGKVLRMKLDGSRPGDNPIEDSLAWTFGHRNSFGFAFDPLTGGPWQTENGPECEDEINEIKPRRNYGWGRISDCPDTSESGPRPVQPKWKWRTTIAVTGMDFCVHCGIADAQGKMIVGNFKENTLIALTLNAQRNDIVAGDRDFYVHDRSVIGVEAAPDDGRIYFSDPRGIYRLVPNLP